jgi:hypothetical protein
MRKLSKRSAISSASIRDAASLYASVLLRYDRAESFANAGEETLRLALRGPNAAVNVPLSEFELIYTEGDGNNTRDFQRRYDTTRTLYAYLGAAPRAMALEDVPSPVIAHVFVRGNANNPGAETPPHFLSCLSAGNPAPFHEGSGRLELAHAIAAKDNPLTARVIVNRVWLHHFGAGMCAVQVISAYGAIRPVIRVAGLSGDSLHGIGLVSQETAPHDSVVRHLPAKQPG